MMQDAENSFLNSLTKTLIEQKISDAQKTRRLDFSQRELLVGNIEVEGMITLSKILNNNPEILSNLIEINLNIDDLTGDVAMVLAANFKAGRGKNLKVLHINGNNFVGEGAVALATSIGSGALPNLQKLKLEHSIISHQVVIALVTSFEEGGSKNLKVLHFASDNIGDEGMLALVTSIGSGVLLNLQKLKLIGNFLGDIGAMVLAASFEAGGGKNLKVLYIKDNNFVGEAGVTLAKSIGAGALPNLKKLDMGNCKLGNEGISALAASFEKGGGKNLEVLYLNFNNIGDKGAEALAKSMGLGVLPNLTKFVACSNHIRNKGLESIADVLSGMHHLKTLRLDSNPYITKEGVIYLIEALQGNFVLSKIIIHERYQKSINEYLNRNKKVLTEVIIAVKKYFIDNESNAITDKEIVADYFGMKNDTNAGSSEKKETFPFSKYERVSKLAIKQNLKKQDKSFEGVVEKIDNLILENYFLLSRICKNVILFQDTTPINLPPYIVANISSFLGYTLLPQLEVKNASISTNDTAGNTDNLESLLCAFSVEDYDLLGNTDQV